MKEIIKSEADARKLSEIASRTARLLIKNGSEVFRIEDTVERICKSRVGIESVDTFATTTSLFYSIKYDGKSYGEVVREKTPFTNLKKIEMTNDFSRKFVSTDMSLDDALSELEKIENEKDISLFKKSVSAGVTSAFFSILFGGNFNDFLSALIIGFLVFFISYRKKSISIPAFITDLSNGFLTALFAAISMKIGFGNNIDMIIIGALMPYVPGVAITNAIRDTLAGDYVSGTALISKAVFTAVALAFGAAVVLVFYFGGINV